MATRNEAMNAINEANSAISNLLQRRQSKQAQAARARASAAVRDAGSSKAYASAQVVDEDTGLSLIEEGSKVEAVLKVATLAFLSPRRLGPSLAAWLSSPQSPWDELELLAFADKLNVTISEELANSVGFTTGEAPTGDGTTNGGDGTLQGIFANIIKNFFANATGGGGGIKTLFNFIKPGTGVFGVGPGIF